MKNKEKITLDQLSLAAEMLAKEVNELKTIIEELQNEPVEQEKWQDKLVQPCRDEHYYITTFHYKGFSVNSAFNTERKPEHAFKTREQAELVKEKMLLMQEMLAFAHAKNEGWKPVWEDDSVKHGIRYKGDTLCPCSYYHANNFVFGIAVKSIKIAEEMLEIFRERIEKHYKNQY